jgi:cytochrome c-type biogenesis protein
MNGSSGARKILLGTLFGLFAVIVFGLIWFFVGAGAEAPVGFGWYLFSFAAGLSMIVLPCTLPLAFIIVPLSMGKGVGKGFAIAVAFGLGVAITLSMYGVLTAALGQFAIGSLGAPLETVKNWLYFIAGVFAYLFALGELGLVNFRMPSYSGAFPPFIQKQKDVLKALLLGLFLGNIGVGCPHPATPVILTRIAVSGDIFYGWLLFFVHAIGRILPLIFLAILGILGVNALEGLMKKKDTIARATGWGMVFVAGFILVLGLFSHDWWVNSGQHTLFEEITGEEYFLGIVAERLGVAPPHTHGLEEGTGLFGLPLSWGTWVLLFLWILPLFWYYAKRKRAVEAMTDATEKTNAKRTLPYLFWNSITLSLLLIVLFGYTLPQRFLHQTAVHAQEEMTRSMDSGQVQHMEEGGMMMDGHGDEHEATLYHEETDVKEGIVVNLGVLPEQVAVGEPATFLFFVNLKPEEIPVPAYELQVQHEKRMHVIGVRRDLNEFFHIHPSPQANAPAVFEIAHTFQKPGEYKIWSEIKFQDENHTFGHPMVSVNGEGETFTLQKEITTSRIVGNYQALAHYDELYTGESHIDFEIRTATGQPAELENYLGEKMHLSVISEDLAQFIHTHPDSGEHGTMMDEHSSLFIKRVLANGGEEHADVPSDHIGFAVNLPKPGFYKMFAQFRPADANLPLNDALTAEFWVQVKEGSRAPQLSVSGAWWRNLVVSVVLIILLGWGVRKYITVR